jgi:hypothetical protein
MVMRPNTPKSAAAFNRTRTTTPNEISRRHPQMTEVIRGKRLDEVDVPLTIAARLQVVPSTQTGANDEHDAVVNEDPVKGPYHYRHQRQSD